MRRSFRFKYHHDRNQLHDENISDASLDLTSNSFDPKKYLATMHENSTITYLKKDLNELSRTTQDKSHELKTLVRSHFDQYLSCHETVGALADEIDSHRVATDALVKSIVDLTKITDSTLSLLLQRAREQRAIRNALNALQQQRPILKLLSAMKNNLKDKSYDKLAENYTRLLLKAKKSSNVAIIQHIQVAARELAKNANMNLLSNIQESHLSVHDLQCKVTILRELGITEKPMLACIQLQLSYLHNKLRSAIEHNEKDMPMRSNLQGYIVQVCTDALRHLQENLWAHICNLFSPHHFQTQPTPSELHPPHMKNKKDGVIMLVDNHTMSSGEAEALQKQVWEVLDLSLTILDSKNGYTLPCCKEIIDIIHSIRGIETMPNSNNAPFLQQKLKILQRSKCTAFRNKLILTYIEDVCTFHRTKVSNHYFMNESDPTSKFYKFLITVDILINSNPQDVHLHQLHRDLLGVTHDIRACWEAIREEIDPVLNQCLIQEGNLKNSGSFHVKIYTTIQQQLSLLLGGFLKDFSDKIIDTLKIVKCGNVNTGVVGTSNSTTNGIELANYDVNRISTVMVVVANCLDLQDSFAPQVNARLNQLLHGCTTIVPSVQEFKTILLGIVDRCIAAYEATHHSKFSTLVRSGIQHDGMSSSAGLYARPYVAQVLFHLISIRNDVERCLNGQEQHYTTYIKRVCGLFTTLLANEIKLFVDETLSHDSCVLSSQVLDYIWTECRFYRGALGFVMDDSASNVLCQVENKLEKSLKWSKATAQARQSLLQQLQLQTKLYARALQP